MLKKSSNSMPNATIGRMVDRNLKRMIQGCKLSKFSEYRYYHFQLRQHAGFKVSYNSYKYPSPTFQIRLPESRLATERLVG